MSKVNNAVNTRMLREDAHIAQSRCELESLTNNLACRPRAYCRLGMYAHRLWLQIGV